MLQIIGWMGCVYLIVKGCELMALTPKDEEGQYKQSGVVGASIAFLAAVAFFFLINAQADATEALSRF